MDFENVKGWLEVAGILLSLVYFLRQNWKRDRWTAIKGAVPLAHRLAQKASQMTATPKDDLYISELEKLLKGFGYDIKASEVSTLKAMGSAEHQTWKLLRDGEEKPPKKVRDAIEEAVEATLEEVVEVAEVIEKATDGGAEGNSSGGPEKFSPEFVPPEKPDPEK